MMESPQESETPAGALKEVEGPDHGEEMKASKEAITFVSSIGEFSVYFLSYSQVSTQELRSPESWHHLFLSHLE